MGAFLRELMNDVRNGDVGVRRCNALTRATPLVLGIIDRENAKIEREKYEARMAAEAEQAALKRERLAEYTAKRLVELEAKAAREASLPRHEVRVPLASTANETSAPTSATPACVGDPEGRATPVTEPQEETTRESHSAAFRTSELSIGAAEVVDAGTDATERAAITQITTHPDQDNDVAVTAAGNAKDKGNTEFDEKAYREEGERLKKLQAEIIARIESRERQSARTPSTAEADNRNSEDERRMREMTSRKPYQSKDVFIGQNFPVDMARMKLDAENEAVKRAEKAIAPGDLARKKLDAQDLELKKEIAHAIAPTTMKYSTFNDGGFVVAKPGQSSQSSQDDAPPKPRAPARARDPDNEPSPIPGLQNRHLNYLRYMGAPVWYLKRLGFVFPRRRW